MFHRFLNHKVRSTKRVRVNADRKNASNKCGIFAFMCTAVESHLWEPRVETICMLMRCYPITNHIASWWEFRRRSNFAAYSHMFVMIYNWRNLFLSFSHEHTFSRKISQSTIQLRHCFLVIATSFAQHV